MRTKLRYGKLEMGNNKNLSLTSHISQPNTHPISHYLISLFISIFLISLCSLSYASDYDGVWFLGFNLHKDIFSDLRVRQAVAYSIDRKQIVKIVSDEVVPSSIIPPSFKEYDSSLPKYTYDTAKASQLLKAAGYTAKDKSLKNLTLLHTDGVVTKKIAALIKKNLLKIGITVKLKEVEYDNPALWVKELKSGRHHMFLMGYKAMQDPMLSDSSTPDAY